MFQDYNKLEELKIGEEYNGNDIKHYLQKNSGAYVISNELTLNDESNYLVNNKLISKKNLYQFNGDNKLTTIKEVYNFSKV